MFGCNENSKAVIILVIIPAVVSGAGWRWEWGNPPPPSPAPEQSLLSDFPWALPSPPQSPSHVHCWASLDSSLRNCSLSPWQRRSLSSLNAPQQALPACSRHSKCGCFRSSLPLLPQAWCEAIERGIFGDWIEAFLARLTDGFNNYFDKNVRIDANYRVSAVFRCFPSSCHWVLILILLDSKTILFH